MLSYIFLLDGSFKRYGTGFFPSQTFSIFNFLFQDKKIALKDILWRRKWLIDWLIDTKHLPSFYISTFCVAIVYHTLEDFFKLTLPLRALWMGWASFLFFTYIPSIYLTENLCLNIFTWCWELPINFTWGMKRVPMINIENKIGHSSRSSSIHKSKIFVDLGCLVSMFDRQTDRQIDHRERKSVYPYIQPWNLFIKSKLMHKSKKVLF